ncbi:AMP-binding protein [Amycolatopsis solani]|uniref:AMP-binding protein n=1 Tax=Amycolatopsis solani TaxID=3028615 RepID=UPI0025B0CA5A|nr:AMP-binding protein [Amycolatopsis sp. MEP2-6]
MISAHDHPLGWDTIHGLFERRRAAAPEAVAVCHGRTARTYAELDEAACRLAARLRARGARRGGYVGVLLDRSPELVVALLAVLKSGAAYIGLEPAQPPWRLGVVLRDAGAALVVTRTDLARRLPGDAGPVVLVDEPVPAPPGDGLPAARARPEDLACVVYAAGSAGRAGVMVEHRCVTAFLAALGSRVRSGPGTRTPQFAGIASDAVVGEIFGPLTSGGAVVLPPPGADLLRLLDRPPPACGAPESTSIVVAAGRPLPSVEAYVLDADLWPVACGAVGELYLGGPTICRGYLGRPALTAELFGPHPFAREPGARLYRTGDLARVLPDGRLEVVGRTDDHARPHAKSGRER